MKSFLVIGMGRFGKYLAMKLLDLKHDVMIVDKNEKTIEELAPIFTNAQIGDCTNPNVLQSIGVEGFNICFVALDEDFQSSLEITSLLKELGAKKVISKASRDMQAKFLIKNGADEVVYPERDIAEKLAIKHSASNVFDYIQLTPQYSIFETPILEDWSGKSIKSLNIRRKYQINILAIKNENKIMPLPSPDYIFENKDHIIIMGKQSDVFKLTSRIN